MQFGCKEIAIKGILSLVARKVSRLFTAQLKYTNCFSCCKSSFRHLLSTVWLHVERICLGSLMNTIKLHVERQTGYY